MSVNEMLMAAAGTGGGDKLYVDDVFSTYLYTGTGATLPINNGIDLAGEGGLVWCKGRNDAFWHSLIDTARGNTKTLHSNTTSAEGTYTDAITSFNNNGFTLGADTQGGYVNASTYTFASWTFRKAPKFFDIVTYTGNGVAGRTVAHNLGSVPGMMIVKCTSTSGNWSVYHRSRGATERGILNLTNAFGANNTIWNDTAPTSTVFTVGDNAGVNSSGATYVAYLFAHDAGGFGAAGTDNVISCGSFTTDGSGLATVNLGYEPQYLLVKDVTNARNWRVIDTMRGWVNDGTITTADDQLLRPNLADAESLGGAGYPFATGFTYAEINDATYIYMAIRRPMKPPTSGTEVFYSEAIAQADTVDSTGVPFPPDLVNTFSRNGTDRTSGYQQFQFVDRLRSLGVPQSANGNYGVALRSSTTAAEGGYVSYVGLKADSQNIRRGGGYNSSTYGNWINYFFRRATGFFDVVCYMGDGNSGYLVKHNLTVVPELAIIKRRDSTGNWVVSSSARQISANSNVTLNLNTTAAEALGNGATLYASQSTTTQVFINGTSSDVNASGWQYVMYLFATLAGVSKVGTFTHDGVNPVTVNCGFTSGARFVLIKPYSTSGDWYVLDTARGIVSAGDPALALNSTSAEITGGDFLDPSSSGFIATENLAAGDYLFLAIA